MSVACHDTSVAATRPGGDRARTAALAFAVFGYALTQTLVVPALSTIRTDLGTSPALGAWVLSAFLLAGVVLTPILGALGDAQGARRILLVTLALFALGGVGAAVAPTIGVLVLARVAQGASLAILPLSFALVRRVVSAPRRAGSSGLLAGIGGAGAGAGLVASGALTDLLGWRAMFGVSAVVAVLAVLGVLAAIPRDDPAARDGDRGRFDLLGAALLAIGLGTILVGLTQGAGWGWTSPGVWTILASGVLVLVLLGVVERRRRPPLLDMDELGRPGILATHVTALLIGAVSYPFYILLPLWAESPTVRTASGPVGFGATITVAGLILLPGALSILLGSNLTAPLVERTGPRTALALGYALALVATLALVLWHREVWQHVVSFVLVGLGTGFVFAAQPRLVALHVPAAHTAAANGVNNIARSIGSILTTQITAAIVVATTTAATPVTDATVTVGLAVTAGLALVGLAVTPFTTRGARVGGHP